MFFWPLVLILLAVVALYLGGWPGSGGYSGDTVRQLWVYLVVFSAGIAIAAAGRLLARTGPGFGQAMTVGAAMAAGVVLAHTYRAELSTGYDRLRGEFVPSAALTIAQGEAELRRNWDGHYRAEAQVNGRPIRLLVDTGASMVLIPYEQVQDIGIDPETLDYSQPVNTANGRSTVAPIVISSIKIGPIVIFDVPAAIARPGHLKGGLLGMSFLDRLSETSFQGDRLILRN